MAKMRELDYESLRKKNKELIVDQAFNIFQVEDEQNRLKGGWVEFLLSGNCIHQMIGSLKSGKLSPVVAVSSNVQEDDYTAGRVVLIEPNLECHATEKRSVLARIENHSAVEWRTTEEDPFFVSYHWFDEDGEVYDFDGKRTPLPKSLRPGESLDVPVDIDLPGEPGRYMLSITIVLEGFCWLEEGGLSTADELIDVLEYDGSGLTRHARDLYERFKAKAGEEAR